MGVTFRSMLVAGVSKSELIGHQMVTTEVTKYDENTGKPYKVKKQVAMYQLRGKKLTDEVQALLDVWGLSWDDIRDKIGLPEFEEYTAYAGDTDPFVGLVICECRPGEAEDLDVGSVMDSCNEVANMLEEAGFGIDFEDIGVRLMCQVG